MDLEHIQKKDAKCLLSAADGWLGLMNFVFGAVSIDNTRYAKIGLQNSMREIDASEEELKIELDVLVGRIRAAQSKHKGVDRVKNLLVQHKKLRVRVETLQRKRDVLQNHLETLENSELNQQVLYSMQRTSKALKAMGLDKSLQSVDKVMLDLEENHSDMQSLQQSLGTSYTDDEDTDWGLELQMLMSDESLVSTPEMCNSIGKARGENGRIEKSEKMEKIDKIDTRGENGKIEKSDTSDQSEDVAQTEAVAEKKEEQAVIE
jgi:hypothetical protein